MSATTITTSAWRNDLTEADQAAIAALAADLPAGWMAEAAPEATFVRRAMDPLDAPMFTVARSKGCWCLGVRWMEGSTFTSPAFPSLEAILGVVRSGVFEAACMAATARGSATTH